LFQIRPKFVSTSCSYTLAIYNDPKHTTPILRETARHFKSINKCVAEVITSQDALINYLAKNKNFNIKNYENIHVNFYRERLIEKYPNRTDYLNQELRYRIMKKESNGVPFNFNERQVGATMQ
jgi:hypothetical protein